MTPRLKWMTAFIAAAAVAIAGAGFYAVRQLDTNDSSSRTLPSLSYVDANFPVRVSTTPGGALSLGSTQRFDATATSNHPIRTLELWDGGRRIDSQAGSAASFTFPALTVGPHLVYVRAVDATGTVSYSRMTNIDVQYSGPATLTNLTTGQVVNAAGAPHVALALRPGETASSVATRLHLSAADVQVSGDHVYVATHAPTVEPMSGNTVEIAATRPGTSAALKVTADSCGVSISGGKAHAALAEASANGAGFVQVAKLDDRGAGKLQAVTPGQHVLFAHSANGDSSPLAIVVPQSCASTLGWKGGVTIIDGILTLPQGFTNAYLYVQDGAKSPYRRFPTNPYEYLPDNVRRIDMGADAPLLGEDQVTVQVWSQQGLTARQIAGGSYTKKAVQSSIPIIFPPTLQVDATDGIWIDPILTKTVTPDLSDFTVLWRTTDPSLAALDWQVSPYPLASSAQGEPPDPVYEWTEEADRLPDRTQGSAIFDPKLWEGITGTNNHGQYIIDTKTSMDQVLQAQLREHGGTVYLRAVALDFNPKHRTEVSTEPLYLPSGIVSPTIAVTLSAAQPSGQLTKFEVTSLTLDNGAFPNSTHDECASVTVDWAANPPPPSGDGENLAQTEALLAYTNARDTYPVSGIWCMAPPHGHCDLFCSVAKGIEAVVDALGSVWDFISSAYDGLIADVVKLAVFLNPVCSVIKGESQTAGDYCDTVTSIAAQAAVDVVLTAYGLPPSLPSSAQLAAAAKGDLTELGEIYLESLGVPCGDATVSGAQADGVSAAVSAAGVTIKPDANGEIDACKALIGAALSTIQSEVSASASTQVAASTGLPGCPITWCTFAVDPGSRIQPPVLHVEAKRLSGPVVPGAVIPVSVSFSSNKDQNSLPPVYAGGTAKLISADGQTIDQDLVFNQIAQYGDHNEYGAAYDPNYHPNGSVLEDDKGVVPDWQITANLADYAAKYVYFSAGPLHVTAGFAPAEADAPQ